VPISARHIFPPLRLSRTSRMTLHTVSVRPEISDQRELRNALGRFAIGVASLRHDSRQPSRNALYEFTA
jgi:hypothetical protein